MIAPVADAPAPPPMLHAVHDAPPPSPAVLAVEDVTLRYDGARGGVLAVAQVSLSLARGERLALVGPSGCGKSSLLRAIGGFLAPTGGRITREGGAPVTGPSPDRMMVFQEFDQLLPWRTVKGNVRFALRAARGLPRAEAEAKARAWIARVGLERFADAYPHTLSGGMKQRVAIARAFAIQPDILLMDEPFAALDALTRRQMQDELLKLCEETHATVIFVTHDIDEAIRISTRVMAMTPHPGRIAAEFASSGRGASVLEREIREAVNLGRLAEPAGEAAR
jgi:NitT/TauT family transport system ATP-binding protein